MCVLLMFLLLSAPSMCRMTPPPVNPWRVWWSSCCSSRRTRSAAGSTILLLPSYLYAKQTRIHFVFPQNNILSFCLCFNDMYRRQYLSADIVYPHCYSSIFRPSVSWISRPEVLSVTPWGRSTSLRASRGGELTKAEAIMS